MDAAVKRRMNTETLTPFGRGGGGCINEGRSYVVDDGSKIYVKYKADKNGARRMFDGEMASLNAIAETEQILVPKPYHVDDYPAGEPYLFLFCLLCCRSLYLSVYTCVIPVFCRGIPLTLYVSFCVLEYV